MEAASLSSALLARERVIAWLLLLLYRQKLSTGSDIEHEKRISAAAVSIGERRERERWEFHLLMHVMSKWHGPGKCIGQLNVWELSRVVYIFKYIQSFCRVLLQALAKWEVLKFQKNSCFYRKKCYWRWAHQEDTTQMFKWKFTFCCVFTVARIGESMVKSNSYPRRIWVTSTLSRFVWSIT